MEFTFFKDDLLHALQALSLYAFWGQKSEWQSNDFNQEESDNFHVNSIFPCLLVPTKSCT